MDYQNIFNQDFYPTPVETIERMIGITDINGKIVLDPSCGSGNIIDYCKTMGAKRVLGCEINDKLRAISSSKCDMIGEDFLTLTSEQVSHVDVIIQNPPFSCQHRHIEHAWDIAPAGCTVISLCNSAMFDRYNYSRSKINDLIKQYGSVEHVGDVFSSSSERKTDVMCSIIRLYKPGCDSDEFYDYFTDEADDPEINANGIIQYNEIRECVNRYVAAVNKFNSVMDAANEINSLICGISCSDFIKFGAYHTNSSNHQTISRDYFKRELQKQAWRWIFGKFHMDKYVTSGIMANINKFVEQQESVPFTMKNIYRMIQMIVGTHSDRMQNVLSDAFDIICSFSADNSTAGDSWKTNSNYMINRKFIIPYMTDYDTRWPSETVGISWSNDNVKKIEDLIKALCFLTCTQYDVNDENGKNISNIRSFYSSKRCSYGEWYEWRFFRIKAFKKGTIHFEFIDEDVWYKFNQTVASHRGWNLPQKSRKRA